MRGKAIVKCKTGCAIVLSGPSGVGKSTLIGLVRQEMPELEFSVSCTTRPPRAGEVDGVSYYFLSDAEFERKLAAGEFIEHAGVFAKRYGTLRREVLERVDAGRDVILDIDVQGAMQIKAVAARDPELAAAVEFVFIVPPSIEVLEQRLRGRATDSEEQIQLRLSKARGELAHWREYDYAVVSGDREQGARDLAAVIRSFRLRTRRQSESEF